MSLSSRRIRAVRAARSRAGAATMLVHADACDEPVPGTHVAVVASRAIGSAVARNRAKRRLRAAAHQARLPEAVDLVVDARRDALAAPFTSLSRDLTRLSARAAGRST